MSYKAIIVRLKNVRNHSNADRLKLATCEGNQIIVGLEAKDGDLGMYFPTDGQLSEPFAKANDLIRRKNPDGTPAGGMFDENKRVRTQKLRGEISDGFWCPVEFLSFIKGFSRDKDELDHFHIKGTVFKEGDELDSIGDIPLCNKYISPKTKQQLANVSGKKAKKGSIMFKEHFDTSHFGRNVEKIPDNSHIILTEKVHGTSQRIGHVKVEYSLHWYDKVAIWFVRLFDKKFNPKSTSTWEYIVGTRRVVLDQTFNNKKPTDPIMTFNRQKSEHRKTSVRKYYIETFKENISEEIFRKIFPTTIGIKVTTIDKVEEILPGFTTWFKNQFLSTGFHSTSLRELAAKPFIDKLHKGETVYYEVVGYEPEGKPIMPHVDITKLGDKEFVKKYINPVTGTNMYYSYGCKPGEFKIFVYRITMTNEDGHSVDYSWNDVKKRCNEIGVEHCPEIMQLFNLNLTLNDEIGWKEHLTSIVEGYAKGKSLLDSSHIREGICIRVERGLEPFILKHKSFEFKVLEGIVKDTGVIDMEEAN